MKGVDFMHNECKALKVGKTSNTGEQLLKIKRQIQKARECCQYIPESNFISSLGEKQWTQPISIITNRLRYNLETSLWIKPGSHMHGHHFSGLHVWVGHSHRMKGLRILWSTRWKKAAPTASSNTGTLLVIAGLELCSQSPRKENQVIGMCMWTSP